MRGELGEVLESEIGRLPKGQRVVFVMRHHQGMKLCEIAEALGLAEGTVKRQLHAAVHRLREALRHAKVTAGERRMTTCDVHASGDLELYFYDELNAAERAHGRGTSVAVCSECRAALDELRVIRDRAGIRGPIVSGSGSGDWSAFMTRLDASLAHERAAVTHRSFRLQRSVPAVVRRRTWRWRRCWRS